jgi:hypothetical protein
MSQRNLVTDGMLKVDIVFFMRGIINKTAGMAVEMTEAQNINDIDNGVE